MIEFGGEYTLKCPYCNHDKFVTLACEARPITHFDGYSDFEAISKYYEKEMKENLAREKKTPFYCWKCHEFFDAKIKECVMTDRVVWKDFETNSSECYIEWKREDNELS